MSEENVQLYHRAYDAFNRHDFDGFVALAHPDIEVHSLIAESLEGGDPYRGHDGLWQYWEKLREVAPDMKIAVAEERDLGDFVVARVHLRGHGPDTDTPFDQVVWQILEWRDGKCVRFSVALSEAEALEAAGLSE